MGIQKLAKISLSVFSCAILTSCTFGVVALHENYKSNHPELAVAEKAAAFQKIVDAANAGDAYAKIQLVKLCFDSASPCAVENPVETLEYYSGQNYEAAMYYLASYRLGLTPLGYKLQRCMDGQPSQVNCIDRQRAKILLEQLSKRGCTYEVQTYEGREQIHPCSRMR
jgi:hypothetical protein